MYYLGTYIYVCLMLIWKMHVIFLYHYLVILLYVDICMLYIV